MSKLLSVIVDDFDIRPACGVLGLLEADPPLQVDADAVLAASLPLQGLEAVAGQGPQVLEVRCGVQDFEALVGLAGEALELPDQLAAGESLGPLVAVAQDHRVR